MPAEASVVAHRLNKRLEKAGGDILRISWKKFYADNEVSALRGARQDLIREQCLEEFGLVVGYGNESVILAKDTG